MRSLERKINKVLAADALHSRRSKSRGLKGRAAHGEEMQDEAKKSVGCQIKENMKTDEPKAIGHMSCEKFGCQQRETLLLEYNETFSDLGKQIDTLEAENQSLREAPKAILEDITSLDLSTLPDAVRCSLISLIEAVFAKHGVKLETHGIE